MADGVTPSRPLVRYHGGKWKIANAIIRHFPTHRCYVEAFGGGGSVLLRKPRAYAEIYNDLDGEIVNLFRVARDKGGALRAAVELTPFARDEFILSYQGAESDVEQARRTLVRAFMGFGSTSATGRKTGFRANSNRSGTTPARDWQNFPDALSRIIGRLRGVVIENRDAVEVMKACDGPGTLHYVDPPYMHQTRSYTDSAPAYRHEMTDREHEGLAKFLDGLQGVVCISGYRSQLYDDLFARWRRVDLSAYADGARSRVESLWFSPNFPPVDLLGATQ